MIVERFRVRLEEVVSIPSIDPNFFLNVPLCSDDFLQGYAMVMEVLCKFHNRATSPCFFLRKSNVLAKVGCGSTDHIFCY